MYVPLSLKNNLSFLKGRREYGENPEYAVCCILVQSSVNKTPNFLARLVTKNVPT